MNKEQQREYILHEYNFLISELGYSYFEEDGDISDTIIIYKNNFKFRMVYINLDFNEDYYKNRIFIMKPFLTRFSHFMNFNYHFKLDIKEYSDEISNGEITKEDFSKQGFIKTNPEMLENDTELYKKLLKNHLHDVLTRWKWIKPLRG